MPRYRLLFLDDQQNLLWGRDVECATDDQAIEMAGQEEGGHLAVQIRDGNGWFVSSAVPVDLPRPLLCHDKLLRRTTGARAFDVGLPRQRPVGPLQSRARRPVQSERRAPARGETNMPVGDTTAGDVLYSTTLPVSQ
jgi:hypothetical protein